MKKETKVERERMRIEALYESIPENKKALLAPLIQNAAFMKVQLEALQAEISANGMTEKYRNGENQTGIKTSAAAQTYNSMIRNYDNIMDTLAKELPVQAKRSRLELFDEENG